MATCVREGKNYNGLSENVLWHLRIRAHTCCCEISQKQRDYYVFAFVTRCHLRECSLVASHVAAQKCGHCYTRTHNLAHCEASRARCCHRASCMHCAEIWRKTHGLQHLRARNRMLVERVAVRGRSCQCAKNAFIATQEEAILCIVGQVERGVGTAFLASLARK